MKKTAPSNLRFNALLVLLLSLFLNLNLLAQPVDFNIQINEKAYTQSFIHTTTDTNYLAKYAVEAKSHVLSINDNLFTRIQVPVGLNQFSKDIETLKGYSKGRFCRPEKPVYQIQYVFYVYGVKKSSVVYTYSAELSSDNPFTATYTFKPNAAAYDPNSLNYAYQKMLEGLKKGTTHSINLVANLIPVSGILDSAETIATGSFVVFIKPGEFDKWKSHHDSMSLSFNKKKMVDNNPMFRQMADSVVKSIFTAKGLDNYFRVTCIQNPCGYKDGDYDFFNSAAPCDLTSPNNCNEAILTYHHINPMVPIQIKIRCYLGNGYRFAKHNQTSWLYKKISPENLNILSITDIKKHLAEFNSQDSMVLIQVGEEVVGYIPNGIPYPVIDSTSKLNSDPGYQIEEVSFFGKRWSGGFVYYAYCRNPNRSNFVWAFDAKNGRFLYKTRHYEVPTGKH